MLVASGLCGSFRVMHFFLLGALALLALPSLAAERAFSFDDLPLDQIPPGFRSTVAGVGKPGDWKLILDEVPAPETSTVSNAPASSRRPVLAQLNRQPLDNRFPILVYDAEVYSDFKLTTRFKIVGGALEQMAGVVFRFQNESNFYVVRASGLGNNFRCYKVENGELKPPLGPDLPISKDVWHTLTVQAEGTRIACALDGNEAIKLVDNSSKRTGKIGFWTKSDSVSYFTDARITYTPYEIGAKALVRDALKEYPRLLGLKIFAVQTPDGKPEVVASKDEKEIGQTGGATEEDILKNGTGYFSKDKGTVSVSLPLRDRNGDPIAAVRVTMESFPGQTEVNAASRAQPVLKRMQARVQSLDDLLQ